MSLGRDLLSLASSISKEDPPMAETVTKLPVKTESKPMAAQTWHPFASLRREVDRLAESV